MLNWYRASPLKLASPGQPLPEEDLPAMPLDHLRVRMPHLVLWGADDTALLPEARAGLEAFCDDLAVVDIPGADHWVLHQKPDEVAARIRDFLISR